MKGGIVAAIPGKKVKIEFDKLDQGKRSSQIGNLAVGIERVRKNGGIYEVMTSIAMKNAQDGSESFRSWVINNESVHPRRQGETLGKRRLAYLQVDEYRSRHRLFVRYEPRSRQSTALSMKLPVPSCRRAFRLSFQRSFYHEQR